MGCRCLLPCQEGQEGQEGSRVWGNKRGKTVAAAERAAAERATARLEDNLAVSVDSKPAKIGSRAETSGADKATGTGACTTFSSFKAASPCRRKRRFKLKLSVFLIRNSWNFRLPSLDLVERTPSTSDASEVLPTSSIPEAGFPASLHLSASLPRLSASALGSLRKIPRAECSGKEGPEKGIGRD